MIPEILRYKIPLDQAAQFEADYQRGAEALRRSPNCQGYELLRSEKDPELYLLTILWDSPEGHLQGFRKSEHFPPFLEAIRRYIPMLLEMEHYHSTPLKWNRGGNAA